MLTTREVPPCYVTAACHPRNVTQRRQSPCACVWMSVKVILHPRFIFKTWNIPSTRMCVKGLLLFLHAEHVKFNYWLLIVIKFSKPQKRKNFFFKHSCSLILCVRMIYIFGQMSDYLSNSWRKHILDKDILWLYLHNILDSDTIGIDTKSF